MSDPRIIAVDLDEEMEYGGNDCPFRDIIAHQCDIPVSVLGQDWSVRELRCDHNAPPECPLREGPILVTVAK